MSDLQLALACHGYDRVQALKSGAIKPDGVDLRFVDLAVEEIFWRQLHHLEFDASEMSFSAYTVGRSRGELPLLAIPIFPSRYFRHSCIFVQRSVERPEELKGKKIAVPEYHMTAAVWIRGMLADDFGVQPQDVEWFTGGLVDKGREEKIQLDLPGLRLRPILDRTLNEMLESGELDGYIGARIPPAFHSGKLVRLFPDFEQVEMDYHRRTGIFPIMHVLAVKEELLERNPWLAMSLFKAFKSAKDQALKAMQDSAALQYALPWLFPAIERTKALMGEDWWPYGVDANRVTLDKFLEYMRAQGLTKRPMRLEELFAPSTLDEFKI